MTKGFVHHQFALFDPGAAVTDVLMVADGISTGPSLAPNPGAVSSMRLRGILFMGACGIVNSAGDWTLGLHVNESGTASHTFTVPLAAFVLDKTLNRGGGDVILDPGDTYHIRLNGPSRNTLLVRATVEWEIL